MKKAILCTLLSAISFLAGAFLLVSSQPGITGAAVGTQAVPAIKALVGLILILLGVGILIAAEFWGHYEPHAAQRMEERRLLPVVVQDAIEHGEHYKLRCSHDFGEAKGATDVYIKRRTADIAPGGLRIGSRIIKIEDKPKRKREFKNLLVLTDRHKKPKTAYVRTDEELKAFFERYI